MLMVGASQNRVTARLLLLRLAVVARADPDPGSLHPESSDAAANDTPNQWNIFFNAKSPSAGACAPALREIEKMPLEAQARPHQRRLFPLKQGSCQGNGAFLFNELRTRRAALGRGCVAS